MTRLRMVAPALGFTFISLIVLVLAPVVLVAGELVNRHYLRGRRTYPARVLPYGPPALVRRRSQAAIERRYAKYADPGWVSAGEACCGHRFGSLAEPFLGNPVWIALTAPACWLLDRIRPRAGHGRRRGNGNGPPPAGVREPRRPRPDQPAGAIACPSRSDLSAGAGLAAALIRKTLTHIARKSLPDHEVPRCWRGWQAAAGRALAR